MRLKFIINKALTIPVHILVQKVYFALIKTLKHFIKKRKDFVFSTYCKVNNINILHSYTAVEDIDIEKNKNTALICKMYLSHKFDLLGSGWVENSYKSVAFGLEEYKYNQNVKFDIKSLVNKSNIDESKRIYNLVDKDYKPIDWQKDFKSGFRWSAKEWYLNQRNTFKGVDIKVPWEIGRLQHLPQLALFAKDYVDKNIFITEFKNQILDFIALNPPRFGVQWACTMDVGIRASNMLLAYDMFKQLDTESVLGQEFTSVFSKSIYEHGVFIVNNLEYGVTLTSNHYLSDIVGLLFIASYLECNDEIDKWLAFSVQEVISEMRKQFYEEGSNFEASTSYHRLSAELMIYATAIILGLPKQKIKMLKDFSEKNWKVKPKLKKTKQQEYKIIQDELVLPQWFTDRLYKVGKFTYDITKPSGEIPQIGDNDSGRFFRLSPNGKMLTLEEAKNKYENLNNYRNNSDLFWDENILNHQTLLAAFGGLFQSDIFKTDFIVEKCIIKSLAKDRKLDIPNIDLTIDNDTKTGFDDLEYSSKKVFETSPLDNKNITDGLRLTIYKNSGIYIFKSQRMYLIISAGSNGQKGNGGHAHNDKLSFELMVDGKDMIVDPGTYLYTPIPNKRNQFRSTKSHSTLVVDNEEQNEWIDGRYGLFSMKNQSKCYLLDYGDNFVDVALTYRNIKQRRQFIIEKDKIVVKNYSNKPFKENYNNFKLFSNGYGKLVR